MRLQAFAWRQSEPKSSGRAGHRPDQPLGPRDLFPLAGGRSQAVLAPDFPRRLAERWFLE